jgi:hypothetical protein
MRSFQAAILGVAELWIHFRNSSHRVRLDSIETETMFSDSSASLPELLSGQNWVGPTEPIHLRTLLGSFSSM